MCIRDSFTAVTQAIIHIFQIVQLRCVPFLEKIVPCILHVIEISPQSLTDYYFQQIAELIITVGDHIRPHVDRIFESIQKFFPTQNLQLTLLNLIQVICEALGSEFKIYVPRTLTLFLAVLTNDSSTDKIVSIEILKTLTVINTNLEDCSHLILPTVIKLCEYSSGRLKETSIIVLGKLIENINSTPMASRIMQALLRNIRSGQEQIIQSSMNTMCILLLKLGTDFAIFIPVVNKTLVRNKIHHTVSVSYTHLDVYKRQQLNDSKKISAICSLFSGGFKGGSVRRKKWSSGSVLKYLKMEFSQNLSI